MFITFEGIEGCGKSTQIGLLRDAISKLGIGSVLTREPGGTPVGEAIRGVFLHCDHDDILPLTELLLVTAARVQHVQQVIRPQLQAGRVVLCDRYFDATVAYQGSAGGVDLDTIKRSHELFLGGLMPDLTLLFDCPAELGLGRSRERNLAEGKAIAEGRFEDKQLDFHEKVRQGYLDLARSAPDRFVVVAADGSIADIHMTVCAAVFQRLREAGYAV